MALGSETPTKGPSAKALSYSIRPLDSGPPSGRDDDLLAPDGAVGAVVGLHEVALVKALAAHVLRAVEGRLLEVVRRERRKPVEDRDVGDGPQRSILLGGRAQTPPGQIVPNSVEGFRGRRPRRGFSPGPQSP